MMTKRQLRRADLVTAPLMLLVSAGAVTQGLQMPMQGTYAGRPIHWYTSPGLFPVLLGLLIFVCSLGVLRRAFAEHAHAGFRHRSALFFKRGWRSRMIGRAGLVWALIGAYIAVLALNLFGPLSVLIEDRPWAQAVWTRFLTERDGINYLLGSFLFLSVFMLIFHGPANGLLTWRGRIFIIGGSAGLSWAVSCVFTEVLYTPLP